MRASDSNSKPRRVLITGAGTGIGAVIAARLASAGFVVILHANRSTALAETLAERLTSAGYSADVVAGDLVDLDGPECVQQQTGEVDILVNNAALSQEKPFAQIERQDFDRVLAVNLWAPFRLTQLVLPGMIDRSWGRIINIASIGGQWGGVNQIHYASAKAGLIGLTRSIAKTYAVHGITANAVSPGLVETAMSADELDRPDGRAKLGQIPLGRVARPDEVAATVEFLASDDAGYITGQTINVNGGMLFT